MNRGGLSDGDALRSEFEQYPEADQVNETDRGHVAANGRDPDVREKPSHQDVTVHPEKKKVRATPGRTARHTSHRNRKRPSQFRSTTTWVQAQLV